MCILFLCQTNIEQISHPYFMEFQNSNKDNSIPFANLFYYTKHVRYHRELDIFVFNYILHSTTTDMIKETLLRNEFVIQKIESIGAGGTLKLDTESMFRLFLTGLNDRDLILK